MKARFFVLFLFVGTGMCMLYAAQWWMQHYLLAPTEGSAQQVEVPPIIDPAQAVGIASRFLDHLDAGQYEEAVAMGSTQLQRALPVAQLQMIWDGLTAQFGPRSARADVRGETIAGVRLMTAPLEFESASLDARIAVDGDGRISGFHLVPRSTDAD